MEIQIPPQAQWSQRWKESETKEILKIAKSLRHESFRLSALSLWRTAEGEFSKIKAECGVTTFKELHHE